MINYEFHSPWWFLALFLIPLLVYIRKNKNKQIHAIDLPNSVFFKPEKSILDYLPMIYFINKLLILTLIIIALARPQKVFISEEIINKNGIDIILAVDVSNSMLARDLKPDRITVLKQVAKKFVLERKMDRIGYVIYAAEAVTKVPLTTDKNILTKTIENTQTGEQLEQGTAIGMGLATAINHLKNSKAKSKIILLMTDGMNNSGAIEPSLAAKIAKEKNIKVYTIGIGTNGKAETPVAMNPLTGEIQFQNVKVEIDENILKQIANSTNGKYFRAENEQQLNEIYQIIDGLEKSKIEDNKELNYEQKYRMFLIIALLLFCLEFITKLFIFKTIL